MSRKYYSIDAFHGMVRQMVKEAIHEHMIQELDRLNLKELGGVTSTSGTDATDTTTGTSGTASALGTNGTKQTNPGNDDPANSILVPGTNLPLNAGLAAASKEKNFKKKAELIKKISDQLTAMKGVVVK